ncbi:MAG: hypothetical protein HKL90_10070 [Elusimicrobia bacterium]|nr:hypothetical protein [Elusimicrobiota bacterium]
MNKIRFIVLAVGAVSISGCLGPNLVKSTPDQVTIGCYGVMYLGRSDANDLLADSECKKLNPGNPHEQSVFKARTMHLVFDSCYYDCVDAPKKSN